MEERDRVFMKNQEKAKKELSSSFARTNASADLLEKEIHEVNDTKKQLDAQKLELEKREKKFEEEMETKTNAMKKQLEQLENNTVLTQANQIEMDQVVLLREQVERDQKDLEKRKELMEIEYNKKEEEYIKKNEMFEEKMGLFERERNSSYVEEEEQRIFQRASLAKQRLALEVHEVN